MASKAKKRKNPKAKARSQALEQIDESPAMLWMMARAKSWCNEPAARSERTFRKKTLGNLMQVELQSVKNFYNQGQIKSKHVFPVLEAITGVSQEDLLLILDNYSFFKEKIEKLSPEKKRLFSLIARLSSNEIFLLNRLLEAGLEANAALKAETEDK